MVPLKSMAAESSVLSGVTDTRTLGCGKRDSGRGICQGALRDLRN